MDKQEKPAPAIRLGSGMGKIPVESVETIHLPPPKKEPGLLMWLCMALFNSFCSPKPCTSFAADMTKNNRKLVMYKYNLLSLLSWFIFTTTIFTVVAIGYQLNNPNVYFIALMIAMVSGYMFYESVWKFYYLHSLYADVSASISAFELFMFPHRYMRVISTWRKW